MAQMARYAMEFCAIESCGKCTPCRIGSVRGVEVIDRLRDGKRRSANLALLRDRGIVHSERAGNNVLYSLSNPKVLKAVDILREVMTETIARREEIHRAAVAGEHR